MMYHVNIKHKKAGVARKHVSKHGVLPKIKKDIS